MTKRTAFALVLLVLTGCRTPQLTTRPGPVTDTFGERKTLTHDVAELSKKAEALLRTQDELVWKSWTQGVPGDIGVTYQGTEALFSPESIRKLERLRTLSENPREIRALTFLQNYFVGEYLALSITDITDAIANLEASLSFNVDGRDYAYRDLERLLANEKSAVKRHELYAGATPSVERLSQSLRRKNDKLESLVLDLGYPSYEAFGAELRQVDLEKLSVLADQILNETDAPYREVLARLARDEVQLPLDRLGRPDLPRLFRPKGVDAFFPKSELLSRTQKTLSGMGLALSQFPNIHLDVKDSPKKNGRGLTLPVEVPGDVRVSLKLTGGVRDQRALLHEMGHALHDGLTTEKSFALSKLGNSTVAEAFSFLFEDLAEDPLWLEQMAGLSGAKLREYLAISSAHELYLLRRAAGKLLYQLALHRSPAAEPGELYKSLMERTYALPMKADDLARAVVDEEDFYPSADYFRARFLAGQLQAQLEARFGPAWWKNPNAGILFRQLFAPGNGRSAEEVAQALGEEGIKPDVLLLRLKKRAGPRSEPLTPEPAAPDQKTGR